jgi:hypothetical protein
MNKLLKSIIATILMKIVVILSIFLSSLAFETPQLCLFCKHSFHTKNIKFSKCSLFPKTKEPEKEKLSYYYCHTARNMDDMCGIEGKKFES